MFEITSEFALFLMGGAIERAHSITAKSHSGRPLSNAPPIRNIANIHFRSKLKQLYNFVNINQQYGFVYFYV